MLAQSPRMPAAVRVPPPRARRARLDPVPGLDGRHRATSGQSAQWQRAHCVKNIKQLRALMGDLLDEAFYADLERDQAERATMSMLLPPQMLNTMVPDRAGAGAASPRRSTPTRCAATCCRCSPTAAPTGRATRTPPATRLHEHDMWVAEGLTHRYPTKVLAELLPTCPQYCGHCTRMDLVGNSTPVVDKLKFDLKPVDRLRRDARLPAQHTPACATSSSPAATWPTCRGRTSRRSSTRLLEIDNIRDIRLATKALMGLPQHWLQRRGRAAWSGSPTAARARGVDLAIHTHVNARQVGHPAGGQGRPGDARRRHARRPQPGRADARRQRRPPHALLDLCFALLDEAGDHAVLLLHVRHDPVQRALAGVASRRRRSCSTRSWATCPASRRRASSATCRSSASAGCTRSSDYDRERGISYWTKNYRTSIEAADADALDPTLRVLRPDRHPARQAGQGWWRQHATPELDP